nr:hypothetical protein [Tanacetum cinerariifolium]
MGGWGESFGTIQVVCGARERLLTDGKSASTLIDTKKPSLKDPDGEDVDVHMYSDYAGASLDRKFTTEDCAFLGFGLTMQVKKHSMKSLEWILHVKCFKVLDYNYKESTIPLDETNSQIPLSNAITTSLLVLSIEYPKDSLIMGNEELNTIPKKESDKFIKSSVEDLVPIPSESKDTSGSNSECILPSCDYFYPIDIPKQNS